MLKRYVISLQYISYRYLDDKLKSDTAKGLAKQINNSTGTLLTYLLLTFYWKARNLHLKVKYNSTVFHKELEFNQKLDF